MENISLELMVHHNCKIPDDEENIPQGIVRFDYLSPLETRYKYLDKYNIHKTQVEVS